MYILIRGYVFLIYRSNTPPAITMDKKLLDALNNLSVALEDIATLLDDKNKQAKSNTGQALQKGELSNTLISIEASLRDLKNDNKDIKDGQNTILNMLKGKNNKPGVNERKKRQENVKNDPNKNNPFTGAGDENNSSKIKDGLSSILLIAVGVLAVGLALKIVGPVDVLSVIGLSIAILIIGKSFADISKIDGLNAQKILMASLALVALSLAIVAVSYILNSVQPVSAIKLFTAVMIAGAFTVLSFGLKGLVAGTEGVNLGSALLLPLILVAVSIAITLSSAILQNIKVVGIGQMFTAIMIAGVFTVLSFGLGKLMSGISNVKNPIAAMIVLPLVMIGLSYAIMESSKILSQIVPITLGNFITAVGISILFTIAAFALPIISRAIENINIGKILLLPVVMVAMAGAITGASWILAEAKTIDASKLFNIVLVGVAVAIIGVALGFSMGIIGKYDNSTMIKGGINLIIIATAIVAASHILSVGNYGTKISLGWVTGVGSALLVFGLATVALGALSMTGIGAGAIVAGALMTLVIAGSIVAASHILNSGNFSGGPSVAWSTATGLALLAFGTSTIALGALIVGTLGIGAIALSAGSEAVSMIAQSIVDTAAILGTGNFTGGPTAKWAGGVAIALGAFSPIYAMLVANKIMSIFGGGIGPTDFNNAIITISSGIVHSAKILKTGNFTGGPSAKWASGVSTALGAFAPVYKVLLANSGFFKSGVSMEDFNNAIATISRGIIFSASIFNEAKGAFNISNVPSLEWGKGVSGAIAAFSPVFKFVSENSGFFSGDATEKMNTSIKSVAWSIVNVSRILKYGQWGSVIPDGYVKSISSAVTQYMGLVKQMDGSTNGGIIDNLLGINSIADSMVDVSKGIDALAKSIGNLNSTIDVDKMNALKNLTGTVVMMSLMDSDQFGSMMDKLEEKSNVLAGVVNSMSGGSGSSSQSNIKTPSYGGPVNSGKSNDDLFEVLSSMDKKLGKISESNNIVSNYINSLNTNINIKKNK